MITNGNQCIRNFWLIYFALYFQFMLKKMNIIYYCTSLITEVFVILYCTSLITEVFVILYCTSLITEVFVNIKQRKLTYPLIEFFAWKRLFEIVNEWTSLKNVIHIWIRDNLRTDVIRYNQRSCIIHTCYSNLHSHFKIIRS